MTPTPEQVEAAVERSGIAVASSAHRHETDLVSSKDGLFVGDLRTLLAEITRLKGEVDRLVTAERDIVSNDLRALDDAVTAYDEYGHLLFERGRDKSTGKPIHPEKGDFPTNWYVIPPHPKHRTGGLTYGHFARLVRARKARQSSGGPK